jgi:RNA polymerase sigma-32 factor
MKKSHEALSREETDAMASTLKVRPLTWPRWRCVLVVRTSRWSPGEDDGEDSLPPTLPIQPDQEPGRILEHEESARLRTQGLEQALANLDPRSRRIIEARWLKETDTATLHELADEFGVSAERIRQIEGQAMKKMRNMIHAPGA